MIFSIYKISNGQIIKIVYCTKENLVLQYDPSICTYIEGQYDDSKYYISNNEAIAIPDAPNKYCIFNYDTKQWYDPRTDETQWVVVRNQRDVLLASCDWTQLPDVEISTKSAWAAYRQSLRDITSQTDPFNIIWPTPPQG